MGSRKTLILVAAIAIGAIGAFILWGWLTGVQDRANGDAQTVDVWVVRSPIDAGKYGQEVEGSIKKDHLQRRFVPANAISSPSQLKDKVAVSKLQPNQIVTTDLFVDPANANLDFSDRLTKVRGEDMVTFTMQADQIRGVAALIQPGDYVNIMATDVVEYDASGKPVGIPANVDASKMLFGSQARYIYQKAIVLAVDQRPVPTPSELAAQADAAKSADASAQPNHGLITFMVPAKVAAELVSIGGERMYLSLVNKDYKPVPMTPRDPKAPLGGEDPAVLTPYGPDGPPNNK